MSANVVAPFDPTKLEEAVKDYFQKWYPEFAAEYERQNGYAPRWFVKPEIWETGSEFKQWQENALPHVVVVCGGLMEPPTRHGNRQTDAKLLVTLVVLAGANDHSTGRALAMGYGAILSWIGDEGYDLETNFIRCFDLVDVDYTTVSDNASVASAAISFEAEVFGYLSGTGGPPPIVDNPRDDPYVEPPVDLPAPPNTTELEIIKKEI